MEQQEQVLFSLPLKRLEPILKSWLREVITETQNGDEIPENEIQADLITREELKKITGLSSDATVIKYEKLDVFRPMRLGRKVFYRKSDVLKSIKEFKRV
jgi:predicted DNA-binding transcriptional regulator AlpA